MPLPLIGVFMVVCTQGSGAQKSAQKTVTAFIKVDHRHSATQLHPPSQRDIVSHRYIAIGSNSGKTPLRALRVTRSIQKMEYFLEIEFPYS
jgi:hypothetical protein